jgi:hypothetical protein
MMDGGRLNLWVTLVDLVLCLPTTFSHVERWDYVNELDGHDGKMETFDGFDRCFFTIQRCVCTYPRSCCWALEV